MGKITIGCFSSLVGSMSLDFAIKFSDAAVKKGHEVDLWLSGNGTMLGKKGQSKFRDYSYLMDTVMELIKSGKFKITTARPVQRQGASAGKIPSKALVLQAWTGILQVPSAQTESCT